MDPLHLLGRGFENEFLFLTAQMSAKKGLKLFGQLGADAISAELQQLHYRQVIKPLMKGDLTREEKSACLHYLMYLKQKRCGKIKARGCADGRKQRLWKTKEETTSPTVRTESVFLSAIIDAYENRNVITCDIPGAFMQADIDEVVHVKFEGEIAELLMKIDEKLYKPFSTLENGKTVIYVELQKALYGTLQAALLFWRELSEFIVNELGFDLNPNDSCVANKIIEGKQCTVLWWVDDLKISHVDQSVIEAILARLNERFGKEQPLTVSRGRIHDYLGMRFDYTVPGQVQVTMFDFIDNFLNEVPSDMKGERATPAPNHLFDISPDLPRLDQTTADLFHTLVAKLLYLCKRTRPDIATAVAFLTTRVSKPDISDYKKLKQCVQYLRATQDMPLTLSADSLNSIEWYVDASHGVHPDFRSHTGVVMTMGRGAAFSMSVRQKLNTKSSTESELVGVSDAGSAILWAREFLLGQGVDLRDSIVYQDNQSAILLERNGRASSGKLTRHINQRFFWIKDRVNKGEIQITHCPTQNMLADLMTKPLQGSQFKYLRNRILNIADPNPLFTDSQECVGTRGQTSESKGSEEDPEPLNLDDSQPQDLAECVARGLRHSSSENSESEKEKDWIVVKGRKCQRRNTGERKSPHTLSRT